MQEMARETYDRGDAVAILPYDPDRRTVLLVRQFRFPLFVRGEECLMIEVAAGLLEGAEPEQRVRAEAEEELGLRPREVREVFTAWISPGSVIERIHFFLAPYAPADRVSPGGGVSEEGEDIEVLEMDFDAALDAVPRGGIRDAKTIMLLQHAALSVFAPGGESTGNDGGRK
jgi:nudix-type nucleoside diphosphatase (YffH/AdpP family)